MSPSDEDSEIIPGGFLNPGESEELQPEPDATPESKLSWGDRMLVPGRPLSARHKKLAELLALGRCNGDIAKELSYTESRVSILRSNTAIQLEAERIRDRLFDKGVKEGLQSLGPDALLVVEDVIRNGEKEATRLDAAKWLIEKLSGKAKQEVSVEAGSTIMQLLQALDAAKMRAGTPASADALGTETRDVIEIQAPPTDGLDSWINQNLTEEAK